MICLTDIHGNFLTMKALLDKIPQEEKDKGIVVCGDLIDRGPRSREVVQYMIDNNIPCVKGNHEVMMYEDSNIWMMNGGLECIRSYGPFVYYKLTNPDDIKVFEEHKEWMKQLPLYLEFPEIKKVDRHLVISHSSINSVWKHKDKFDSDGRYAQVIMWGRPNTINDVPEIYNVFGHTPQENGAKIKVPFANIDTGCFYKEKGYGRLTALQFPELIIYEQENID